MFAFGFETCIKSNRDAIQCTSEFYWCKGRHCILNIIFQVVFIVIKLLYTLFFNMPHRWKSYGFWSGEWEGNNTLLIILSPQTPVMAVQICVQCVLFHFSAGKKHMFCHIQTGVQKMLSDCV